MNPPHSRPAASNKPGSAAATGLARAILVMFLAYAVPVLVLALDYEYFGPVVRFGPFIVWTAAALGMAGYAAGRTVNARAFLAGIVSALLAGGTLLAAALALTFLPIVLIARSVLFTVFGTALIGTTLVYGRRWRTALRARPRNLRWTAGLIAGLLLLGSLPTLAQSLHDRHFARRLEGLRATDPLVRARTLQSLVGSRFCWSGTCTNAVCEARDGLDADTVRAVLGGQDIDLICDEPGLSEWPG